MPRPTTPRSAPGPTRQHPQHTSSRLDQRGSRNCEASTLTVTGLAPRRRGPNTCTLDISVSASLRPTERNPLKALDIAVAGRFTEATADDPLSLLPASPGMLGPTEGTGQLTSCRGRAPPRRGWPRSHGTRTPAVLLWSPAKCASTNAALRKGSRRPAAAGCET